MMVTRDDLVLLQRLWRGGVRHRHFNSKVTPFQSTYYIHYKLLRFSFFSQRSHCIGWCYLFRDGDHVLQKILDVARVCGFSRELKNAFFLIFHFFAERADRPEFARAETHAKNTFWKKINVSGIRVGRRRDVRTHRHALGRGKGWYSRYGCYFNILTSPIAKSYQLEWMY